MKFMGLLLLTLLAARAAAATAYVSDELVLGLYAEQNGKANAWRPCIPEPVSKRWESTENLPKFA